MYHPTTLTTLVRSPLINVPAIVQYQLRATPQLLTHHRKLLVQVVHLAPLPSTRFLATNHTHNPGLSNKYYPRATPWFAVRLKEKVVNFPRWA